MDCKEHVSFETLKERMALYMAKHPKLRKTEKREVILKVIYDSGRHLTPDEVYREMCDKYDSKIGISTVYRTLTFFEEAGLVNVVMIGNETKRYEIKCDHHHDHMICLECGSIIEFTDEAIETLQEAVAKRNNFKMIDHDMTIYGFCSNCQT